MAAGCVRAVNFALDSDQLELQTAVRELLSAESGADVVRAAMADRDCWRSLWATVAELGWQAVGIPEELGGAGLGPVECAVVLEQAGIWLFPAPLLSTMGLAAGTLTALKPVGAARPALRAMAAGTVATLAPDDAASPLTWENGTLHGRARLITDAERAQIVVLATRGPAGDPCLAVVRAGAGIAVEGGPGVDPSRPLSDLVLTGAPAEIVAADPEPGIRAAMVGLSAELVGVAQRALDASVEHAREREQFGHAIGSFQAIKHRLADVYVAVERARSLVYGAAMALQDPASAFEALPVAVSLAKAAASEAALLGAKVGIQVHGALGMSAEHDMHLILRRARQGAHLLGDARSHYAAVGFARLAEAG